MKQTLEKMFTEMTGKETVMELAKHLSNANGKLPAFALPATIDAIKALGKLCRRHTNANGDQIDTSMSLVSAALVNALTDHTITIVNDCGQVAES